MGTSWQEVAWFLAFGGGKPGMTTERRAEVDGHGLGRGLFVCAGGGGGVEPWRSDVDLRVDWTGSAARGHPLLFARHHSVQACLFPKISQIF